MQNEIKNLYKSLFEKCDSKTFSQIKTALDNIESPIAIELPGSGELTKEFFETFRMK